MKLNLLPTYVSKEKQVKQAVIAAIFLFVLGLGGMLAMITLSSQRLAELKTKAAELKPQAEEVVAISSQADQVLQDGAGIVRNVNLAAAMNRHNGAYPALYDYIKPYIPSFYRVTSMSATPGAGSMVTVTLNGVLTGEQNYANLMLALLRINPEQATVARTGFLNTSTYVPALSQGDQTARPIKPGEAPIPDDPNARLEYFVSRGGVTGYTGVGGFGAGTDDPTRGAMPDYSTVSVTWTFPFEYPVGSPVYQGLQTPDPDQTLRAAGAAPVGGAPTGVPTTPTTGTAPTSGTGPGGNVRGGSVSD
jgi:hypothetical protein